MTLLTLAVTPRPHWHLAQLSQAPSSQSWPHLTAQSLSRPGARTSEHREGSVSTRGQEGKRTQERFRVWEPNPH